MEQTTTLLEGHSDEEKGAYLAAIASIATADHSATQVEIGYLRELAEAAELSQQQEDEVIFAATNLSGEELNHYLNVLKSSDLKYSLVTDLISFAEADKNYSQAEKANIEKIAAYLDIKPEQYSALNQFVEKSFDTGKADSPNFLASSGLEEKFKSAGLNMGSIMKGLIAVAGPLILSKMMNRRSSGNAGPGNNHGGLLDGLMNGGLGGLLGGLTGNSGNNNSQQGSGGLGSIIGMLNGGRGFSGVGGLLGKILGNK